MAKIKLTPSELIAQGAEMNGLKSQYENLFLSVEGILQAVNQNWSANLSNNFSGKLKAAQDSFAGITVMLQNGAQAAVNSAGSFESLDSQLASMMMGQNEEDSALAETSEKKDQGDIYDVTDWIKGMLGTSGKILEKDEYGYAGATLGYITALTKAMGKAVEGEADIQDYLKIMDKGFGVTGKLLDSDRLGILSSLSGLLAEGKEIPTEEGIGKTLSGLDGVIEEAGNLSFDVGDCLGLKKAGLAGTAEAQKALTGIVTAFTMGTHLVGDVISYSEDGNLSAQDIADTLIDTGAAGGTSLVKGLTFGLLDIDAEGAVQTYKDNAEAVSDFLYDTGIPLEAQCVLGVVSAPVTFAVSTVEIAAETVEKPLRVLESGVNWAAEKVTSGVLKYIEE